MASLLTLEKSPVESDNDCTEARDLETPNENFLDVSVSRDQLIETLTEDDCEKPPLDVAAVAAADGQELKTANATLRIPKGSLDKETYIRIAESHHPVVPDLDQAGLVSGVDFVISPLISLTPASLFLRCRVVLRVRNLFAPYPLDSAAGVAVVLIKKNGINDKNATDGWESAADSRLYTSISWRYCETWVEVETKVLGDFIILLLFGSPLPPILSFIRLERFPVQFSFILHRDRRRFGSVDEEGVNITLLASTDPNNCGQLNEYKQQTDSCVVFGPFPSLFPLCHQFPFEFFLLHCDAGAKDSINVDKCRSHTTGQQRTVFVPDSPSMPIFVDVICISSSHPLPAKRQVPICDFIEITDASLRKGLSLIENHPTIPNTVTNKQESKAAQSISTSTNGAVIRNLASKRKSVGFLAGKESKKGCPPIFGQGFRLGSRHFLTHWSAIDAAYHHFPLQVEEGVDTGVLSSPSPSQSSLQDTKHHSTSTTPVSASHPTEWEILFEALQRNIRVWFGDPPSQMVKESREGKDVFGISGLLAWDVSFTLNWVLLELSGSEKRFPPSLESLVNPSVIKEGAIFFCGKVIGNDQSTQVKMSGLKIDSVDEAVIQPMKKGKREENLRKIIENRGHVMANEDKSLVRNPLVSIVESKGKLALPGSPGFDPSCRLSFFYLKGFGRLETAVPMATVKETMNHQAEGNQARKATIGAVLPINWN